ncbi:MFS transporter [Deinococcus yavapaiensis]|uniref:Fucose permease n=1 Tax=Deinococcus yavapaiensis KR-236 TaxID=694435 RepID=A0A318S944_9DEIO|nr:hypothetical protein [Deinococcus yavapaiensis]PYE54738.1 hypothetical protein DES52_1048 [Deinococcus yavapaiensis KR-236]
MRGPFSRSSSVLFGFYALLGFVDASFGVAYHTLLQKYNLDMAALAAALLWGTAAALPLLWYGGRLLGPRSKRSALRLVGLAVPLLAWSILLAPSAAVFLVGVAGLLVVTALLDMSASGAALDLEASGRPPLLGRVQSGFAVGAVSGALLGGLLVEANLGVLLGAFVTVVAAPLLLGSRALPKGGRIVSSANGAPKVASRLTLAVIGGAALVAYYAEGMMQSWSATFLQRDLGASANAAGLLAGAYYVAFGVGAALSCVARRTWGTRGSLRLLAIGAASCAVALVNASEWSLAALALLGLGVTIAGLIPILLSWGANAGLGAGAAGFVSTFAYAGMLLEPLAVRFSGDSLRPVLLTLPPLLLLVAGATFLKPAEKAVLLPAGD